ncbi:Tetratricopeptide repeat-containing protein [Enhydrobacter aerosaccus]|uniref:Tetratricopeptide repeat-containing protein n=2 Tax=Enhydrobacter aerosaccus TaxID=225324 RepID=A0A1T4QB41_9HYPH|nr:Tetratricopeptide repeat-containing protein [Enhydrobacter aerosaccus]
MIGLMVAAGWTTAASGQAGSTTDDGAFFDDRASHNQESEEDRKLGELLIKGAKLSMSGRQSEAIFMYFDRVASVYEARYKDKNVDYFCARHMAEQLFYLVHRANSGTKRPAVMAPINWALSYYLKAHALVDLGRPSEAKAPLERALALAPQNALFLSERGYLYQMQKDWPASLETYKQAEAAAQQFSPNETRNTELARAWRGQAYTLIETNHLSEAEALYRKCLDLDPNDAKAKRELQYIAQLRRR